MVKRLIRSNWRKNTAPVSEPFSEIYEKDEQNGLTAGADDGGRRKDLSMLTGVYQKAFPPTATTP